MPRQAVRLTGAAHWIGVDMSKGNKVTAVPDDVVADMECETFRLSIYSSDVLYVTLKVAGGRLPLRLGEVVEAEVVEIERKVTER